MTPDPALAFAIWLHGFCELTALDPNAAALPSYDQWQLIRTRVAAVVSPPPASPFAADGKPLAVFRGAD